MKNSLHLFTGGILSLLVFTQTSNAQPTPQILHYKFDEAGTTVTNMASNPPAGTATATIMGGLTQGSTGQCSGALIGSGIASSTDYLNTGFATALTGSWTISMWTKDITASATLFYIFGDNTAGSFRCFTNGVAGANNWLLRGPFGDVLLNGGATVAPHICTFVYDQTAGNIYAYLDGVLVNTVAQTPITISGTGPFKVMGYGTNVGAPAGGLLDEFRLYDYALSAAEVAELIIPGGASSASVTSCDSYLWTADGNTYTTSGNYMATVPNIYGCDSLVTLNLTITNSSAVSESMQTCDSYIWPTDGNTYTSTGMYTVILPAANGCDSVITLDLTILNSVTATDSVVACDNYLWPADGNTYNTSGLYSVNYLATNGCDSIISINLTINPSTSSTINETTIDTYTSPGGTMYTTSGMYTDVIPNANGCDSTITINLTINYTGLSEQNTTLLSLYPNPSSSTISIQGIESLGTLGKIYLTTTSGAVIAKYDMMYTSPINVADLPKGIYYIRVEHADGVETLTFIVK